MATMGRPTLFGPKRGGRRVQGLLTREGTRLFKAARARVAGLWGKPQRIVSDGDVIEYLARGDDGTRVYLKEKA